jgi:predicted Ser/Thr protein kinase
MTVADHPAGPPALRALWQESLSGSDPRCITASLRPPTRNHAAAGDARISSEDRQLRLAAAPGAREPGLIDVEGLRSGPDRYVLGEMLGRGGMSVVLAATQRTLAREVAVKVARFDLDEAQRERFRAEARLTAWLEHPHITPIHEAGRNYLVMRRIAGGDLERLIAAGTATLPELVEILIRVCDAVAYAHHRGVVHRDIKPENILVGDFGEVMLIDWGLAIALPGSPAAVRAPLLGAGAGSSPCAGTPGYMPPEVALGDAASIGPASDVYLLGATLYCCLGGGVPFAGADVWEALERSAANAWSPLSGPRIPRRLAVLQEQAMSANPAERPGVREFQAGLRAWLLSSRAEADAAASLERARSALAAARADRLQPHAAYGDYIGCIAACDRALALHPELEDAARVRADAVAEFALAAVGAGELQLARLIKESGRLPLAPRPEVAGESSTVRRIASLVGAQAGSEITLRRLVAELVERKRENDRLASSNDDLRAAYEALARDRDRLASAGERAARRRRLAARTAAGVAAALVAIWVLAAVLS